MLSYFSERLMHAAQKMPKKLKAQCVHLNSWKQKPKKLNFFNLLESVFNVAANQSLLSTFRLRDALAKVDIRKLGSYLDSDVRTIEESTEVVCMYLKKLYKQKKINLGDVTLFHQYLIFRQLFHDGYFSEYLDDKEDNEQLLQHLYELLNNLFLKTNYLTAYNQSVMHGEASFYEIYKTNFEIIANAFKNKKNY